MVPAPAEIATSMSSTPEYFTGRPNMGKMNEGFMQFCSQYMKKD
jgi:hypothetical protein